MNARPLVYIPLNPEDTTGDADIADYEEALAAAEEERPTCPR